MYVCILYRNVPTSIYSLFQSIYPPRLQSYTIQDKAVNSLNPRKQCSKLEFCVQFTQFQFVKLFQEHNSGTKQDLLYKIPTVTSYYSMCPQTLLTSCWVAYLTHQHHSLPHSHTAYQREARSSPVTYRSHQNITNFCTKYTLTTITTRSVIVNSNKTFLMCLF